MAQKELESDEFGPGSLILSHLLGLERRLGDFRECEPEAHHSTIEYIVQLRRDSGWECEIYIQMAFLNPSVQFRVGRTCSDEAYERVRATLIQLVQGEIDRDIDHTRAMPEEPASDDFRSFLPSEQPDVFGAEEQVSVYTRTRASASHPLSYWHGTPAELRHLTTVALRVLGFVAISASVEKAFSVPVPSGAISRRIGGLPNRCWLPARNGAGWSQAHRELEERKLMEDEPWRLGITEEMGTAHMLGDWET
jgi:hypothetical protein